MMISPPLLLQKFNQEELSFLAALCVLNSLKIKTEREGRNEGGGNV